MLLISINQNLLSFLIFKIESNSFKCVIFRNIFLLLMQDQFLYNLFFSPHCFENSFRSFQIFRISKSITNPLYQCTTMQDEYPFIIQKKRCTQNIIYNIGQMEEGCLSFGRRNDKNKKDQNLYNQKLEEGLNYPVYIITSSYNSIYLGELQKYLEKKKISISFQTSLGKFTHIKGSHQRRVFIVLNDFSEAPILHRQFLNYSCLVAQYPKMPLDKILQCYQQFIEQQKTVSKDEPLQKQIQYLAEENIRNQLTSSEQTSSNSLKIHLKSISKTTRNYKSSFPQRLFVYSNGQDDEFYQKGVNWMKQYLITQCHYITRIEDYLKHTGEKQDVRYTVLMSSHSAINLRKYFKKCDQMIVLTQNADNCLPLLRGKVTQIICDLKSFQAILHKNFKLSKLENKQSIQCQKVSLKHSQKSTESQRQDNNQQPNYLSQNLSNQSFKCAQNLKIIQQFPLTSQMHKQLALQSSAFCLTITPQSKMSVEEVKENISDLLTLRQHQQTEECIMTPLKIVKMNAENVPAYQIMGSSFITQNSNIAFTQIVNNLDYSRNDKIQRKSNIIGHSRQENQNILSTGDAFTKSDAFSQMSHSSRRSSRNSRIIQRFKDLGSKLKKKL